MTATCQFWVQHKRRFCKFQVATASTEGMCAVHSQGVDDKERVPCPVDPRHMIYKIDTEKHVKKCSLIIDEGFSKNQPFTLTDCNVCSDEVLLDDSPVAKLTDELLSADRLAKYCSILVDRIRTLIPGFSISQSSDHIRPAISAESADEVTKHDMQNAAILQELNRVGLTPSLSVPRLYVELGCGKAGLSRWLMHSLESRQSAEEVTDAQSVFVLLDYEARRNKQENRRDLHGIVSPDSIVRLRSNIKDVDLSQFLVHVDASEETIADELPGKPGSPEFRIAELKRKISRIQSRPEWPLLETVGTAKHLCGAATDLGLRCLERIKDKSKISLCFATCCHHRCDWTQLVGRSILTEIGACSSATDFQVLCNHAGWATTIGLADEKRKVGRLIKELIDLSRVHWISITFKGIGSLQYRPYIDGKVTPENFAIVVRSRND